MTRPNGTIRTNGRSNGDTLRRVAVLHRQGDQWQILLARNESGRPRIEQHHTVSVRDPSRLDRILGDFEADRIVRVLPGGSVICRVIEIPDVEDASAEEAAALQAESLLPLDLEDHRRTVAILPWRTGMGGRLALVTGWPGVAPDDLTADERLRFTSEAACLAELLAAGQGEGIAGFADRDHHSLELVAQLAGSTSVRTVRLDDPTWVDGIERVLVETALAAGLDDESLDRVTAAAAPPHGSRQALLLDESIRRRLSPSLGKAPADESWWTKYGVAAGAALGALGPRHALFEVSDQPPSESGGALVSALSWVSHPRRTRAVLAAAVLMIAAAPVLGALARHEILRRKTRDLDEVRAAFDQRQEEALFFRTLNQERWPMTKLLADLAGQAPYNVEFDFISISSANRTLSVKGSAPVADGAEVFEFQEHLGRSNLFTNVKFPTIGPRDNRVQFEMTGGVRDPHFRQRRPFEEPRRVIAYGEEARDTEPTEYVLFHFGLGDFGSGSPPAPRPRTTPTPTRDPAPRSGSVTFSESAGDDAAEESGVISFGPSGEMSGSTSQANLPPPLSEGQIAAMDRSAITQAMSIRGRLKNDRTLDPEALRRLNDEYDRLLARFRAMGGGAGGAGATEGAVIQ